MKTAQIVVLGVALGAAGIAAYLMAGSEPPPPPPPQQQAAAPIDTVEILVAKTDINMGQVVSPNEMQWQIWPTAAASANFVRKSDRPDAIQQLTGSIARSPMVLGEPIREAKLIKANGSGFMAAILPSGMRAISTDISPETGAGGFILPNDHVDVILSRRDKEAEKASGVDVHTSETILTNVRVLAIDQTVEEKNGQRVVVGKTATLELSPRQAEQLALSRQLGTLTLALRSIIDASAPPESDDGKRKRRAGAIERFGQTVIISP
ncbi:MAG TPA: Flp pilus assembly protein CpaB [Xanthobacteraceae bacterium]|nr:Flp pilus assembly protein CpaB [Xanthobacteraceae bacterium]